MLLELSKGANAAIATSSVLVAIGWKTTENWEIDASAFLIGLNERLAAERVTRIPLPH